MINFFNSSTSYELALFGMSNEGLPTEENVQDVPIEEYDEDSGEDLSPTHQLGAEMSKRDQTNFWLPPKRSAGRKKRKRQPLFSELVAETVPLNDIRRSYAGILQSVLNRSNCEEILGLFESIAASPTDFLTIVRSAESENPNGPVYREMQGIESTARCFAAYAESMPDVIASVTLKSFYKRRKGDSEVHCRISYAGSVTKKVVVENPEQTADISSAISGLNSLGTTSTFDQSSTFVQRINSTESIEIATLQSTSSDGQGKVEIPVGETDIVIHSHEDPEPYKSMFIASQKTRFRVAETVLPQARSFQTSGTMILSCNTAKKVCKVEIIYSSQEATKSSKYTEVAVLLNDDSKTSSS